MPVTAYISYQGDSVGSAILGGNDVVLYDFCIPEPATVGMLVLLIGLGMLRRRGGTA